MLSLLTGSKRKSLFIFATSDNPKRSYNLQKLIYFIFNKKYAIKFNALSPLFIFDFQKAYDVIETQTRQKKSFDTSTKSFISPKHDR